MGSVNQMLASEGLILHLQRVKDKKERFQQAYLAMKNSSLILHGDHGYSFCIHGQPLIICTVWGWRSTVYMGKRKHYPYIKHTETLPNMKVFQFLLYHSRVTSLKKRMFPASEEFGRLTESKLNGIAYWLENFIKYNHYQPSYRRVEAQIAIERFLIKQGFDTAEQALEAITESLNGNYFVYDDMK